MVWVCKRQREKDFPRERQVQKAAREMCKEKDIEKAPTPLSGGRIRETRVGKRKTSDERRSQKKDKKERKERQEERE